MENRYEKIEKIGEGGFGIVYKAQDVLFDKIVAVKVIKGRPLNQLKEFLKEIKDMDKLDPFHINVIRIFNAQIEDDQLEIAMEYFEGISLRDLLKNGVNLKDEKIVELMKQTLDGLAFIHSKMLVHRDIKPDNILVNKNHSLIKIIDFGISKDMNSENKYFSGAGTPAYMSPEQADGAKGDHKSDIYNLGVVLYELKTGSLPFSGGLYTILKAQVSRSLPKTKSFLDPIIQKATKKNPKDRYQSAEEFKQALTTAYEKSKRKKSFAPLYWFLIILLIGVFIYYYRSVLMPTERTTAVDVPKEDKIEQILPESQKTVIMGSQVWMSDNLNTKVFRNGDPIPEARTKEEWNQFCKEKKPAFYYPDYDQKNGEKYGLLYNWYAAIDQRNICPEGFRIPGKKDFDYLMSKFNFNDLSSNLIRVFPGYRDQVGYYLDFDSTSTFWSKDEYYPGCQYTLTVSKTVKGGQVKIGKQKPIDGYSIRCIKE